MPDDASWGLASDGELRLRLESAQLRTAGGQRFTESLRAESSPRESSPSESSPSDASPSESSVPALPAELQRILDRSNPSAGCVAVSRRFGQQPYLATLSYLACASEPLFIAFIDALADERETCWRSERHGFEGEASLRLELSLPDFERGLASAIWGAFWTKPHFIGEPGQVPSLTQFLLWQHEDGTYSAIVPLTGGDVATFLVGDGGHLFAEVSTFETGSLRARGPLFVAGSGADPYALVERVYREAVELLGGSARLRVDKRYPECFEHLGWCTWDAFYRDVDAPSMRRQMQEFARRDLRVGFVLLDDGWFEISHNQLIDMYADRRRFPEGLAAFFDELRHDYAVGYIGVWHALLGYWYGVSPAHRLEPDVAAFVRETSTGALNPGISEQDASGFFNAWHAYLRDNGADFIKVDGQGMIGRVVRDHTTLAEGSRCSQQALQASAALHFNGDMVNCMSMNQNVVWQYSMSNITRSSEDYMYGGKERPLAAHAKDNAYNSLWLGQLSWCDWDMFRTDQTTRQAHAALRALSGGPIYISDGVGVTEVEALRPLMLRSGRLLRCDDVGVPAVNCLLRDPERERVALSIKNRAADAYVLGLFNVHESAEPITAEVSAELAGADPTARYVVWCSSQGEGCVLSAGGSFDVTLQAGEGRVYLLYSAERGFAPIGLEGKLIAGKTLSHCECVDESWAIEVAEGGKLICWSQRVPRAVRAGDGRTVASDFNGGFLRVEVPESEPRRVHVEF